MTLAKSRYVIGGDFELPAWQLGNFRQLMNLTFGLSGTWTASGRAALALILQHLKSKGVQHIHLPAYLCQSILQPVQALGFKYSFYPVDSTLTAQPDPLPGSAVLLIHYFGWKNPVTESLRSKAGKDFFLIEDACQALLSDVGFVPNEGRFIIISPRKFVPAVLGGWCNLPVKKENPSVEIEAMVWQSVTARMARAIYLMHSEAALDHALEEFYLKAFSDAERFLDAHPTYVPVPQIVLDLLAGFDWEMIKQRRRNNWLTLNEQLSGRIETIMPELSAKVVPLGYVVRLRKRSALKAQLAKRRIFCPVHWLLPSEIEAARFPDSAQLADTCLTLPIDQRYVADDLLKMAQILMALQ